MRVLVEKTAAQSPHLQVFAVKCITAGKIQDVARTDDDLAASLATSDTEFPSKALDADSAI